MVKTSKFLAFVVAAAFAVATLAGCASQTSASSSSQEAQKEHAPLSVAYLNKAGYEDIIVGDKKGFFKDAGPEVVLHVVSGSGQQSVEALLAGSVDVAVAGQGPVADAIKQYGDEIVVLACTNCYSGGQVWVAGPGMAEDAQIVAYDKAKDNKAEVRASFESAAAARGGSVKVGVQKGSSTEGEFKSWLKAMDISFNDFGSSGSGVVTLVDVKANTLPTTLATGKDIDMMAASQPFPGVALEQIPGAYQIGTNADISSYTLECLVTTKKVYAEKEDSIKAFMTAQKRVVDFMNANPEEAAQICADSIGCDLKASQSAFAISEFQVGMSDQAVAALLKTCEKKGAEVTEEQLRSQIPLLEWFAELNS